MNTPRKVYLTRPMAVAVLVTAFYTMPVDSLFAQCNESTFINVAGYSIPNFGRNAELTSVNNGDWSNPNTWSPQRVPGINDDVCIGQNTTVTLNVNNAIAKSVVIQQGATLFFMRTNNTRLQVDNLMVLEGGTLDIGTTSSPIPDNVTAVVEILDRPVNTTPDPEQFGHGLIGLGTVRMHGSLKSFSVDARLSADAMQGSRTITLQQPVNNWKVDDLVILPDTRLLDMRTNGRQNYVPQWEEGRIESITNGGRTITLRSNLNYSHRGSYDGFLMPHIGNLTRNVIFRSASASNRTHRGTTFFTGNANVDIRYVEFRNIGRTTWDGYDTVSNHRDRYAITLRQMNSGPTFIGNAIYNSVYNNSPNPGSQGPWFMWGFSLDDVSNGNFTGNTVYQWGGSTFRIMGLSRDNTISKNFLMGVIGIDEVRAARGTGRHGNGISGEGQYIMVNNYEYNVAASMQSRPTQIVWGAGYVFGGTHGGSWTFEPIQRFFGNEAYGAIGAGMTLWFIGTDGFLGIRAPNPMGVIENFKVYNAGEEAFFGYPLEKITFRGLVFRGDPSVDVPVNNAFGCGDYQCGNIIIENADIRGSKSGIHPGSNGNSSCCGDNPDEFIIRNSYFEVKETAIGVNIQQTPGAQSGVLPSTIRIENCEFVPYGGPNPNFQAISMDWELENGSPAGQENVLREVLVTNFNKIPGQNFQIYYTQQEVPGTGAAGGEAPCAGNCGPWKTNALNWMKNAGYSGNTWKSSFGLVDRPIIVDTVAPAPPTGLRVQ